MRKLTPKLTLALFAICSMVVSPPYPTGEAGPETYDNLESKSGYVIVEELEPAFIVFTGLPKGIDEKELESIRTKVAEHETANMLTWDEFTSAIDGYAQKVMRRNDYPDAGSVRGLVCLVATQPGAPWGLAWNGGIALTRNDYQHTRRTYKMYTDDPEAYEPVRDPRRDPVHPHGHLPYFGCE